MTAWVAGLAGTISAAWATVQVTPATLTATVTVSRAGGGPVKGQIQDCTPELLTVLPSPRPKLKDSKAPDPSPAEPVAVPWKDVRAVSNGLTARVALDLWKARHAEKLCPDCRGDRTVPCPTCKGTDHDPAAAAACKTCHGELLVACESAGEIDGRVACPNGCMRRDQGTWSKGPDGLMRRTFQLGGGSSVWFHEPHVGDVILLDLKAHTASDTGRCLVCGGTTEIDDPACHGTGKIPCPECLARKSAPPCPAHCDGGRIACPTCHGTGLRAG